MANVFIEEQVMTDIGEAIRTKDGTTEKILPADMAAKILAIETNKPLDGEYVWQVCTIGHDWEYTSELIGTEKPSDASGTSKSSFTITDDGCFELSTTAATLSGYYLITGANGKSIYYAEWKYATTGSYYNYYLYTIVDSNVLETKGTPIDVVTSDTITDYPENGVQDGYWYVLADTDDIDELSATAITDIHVWEKYTLSEYTLKATKYSNVTVSETSLTAPDVIWEDIKYSDGVDYSTGEITLASPITTISSVSTVEQAQPILGKYIYSNYNGNFYFVPSDATIEYEESAVYPSTEITNKRVYISTAYKLSVPNTGELVGVVATTDVSLYPSDGEQDGYKYLYKGTVSAVSA